MSHDPPPGWNIAIDALLDDRHPLKMETAAWAAAELAQRDLMAHDEACEFAHDDWMRCAERGIQGLLVPERFGGRGLDLASALLILEGLGLGCRDNGLTFALASQIVSHQLAIERFGSEEQKARWLPGLCAGTTIGAFAITEPDHGSDTTHMDARAELRPDGSYVLNGEKAYITLAARADLLVVFAATRPEAAGWGITAFIVPTDTPGVELGENKPKMGMRTTPFCNITLDDVVVPADCRLGPEGAGFSIFTAAMEAERAFVFITQVGAMERVLDETVAYASRRHQGGVPIGNFQGVSHRVADMKTRHEIARILIYKTALLVLDGKKPTLHAALTKLTVSEHALASSLDAVRVHGAVGYVSQYGVEREHRDAVGGLVYSGTSEIQRNIIARLLGVGS
jgi:alkylation response protein AidB-like acyl-CoA dehydrogenase